MREPGLVSAMISYEPRFPIGARVKALSIPAMVIAITFRANKANPQYEVRFDSGGANAILDEAELSE